ncbi:MAG TPA: AAA family ATPase [Acidobacteriaceae bacterium]|jgi:pilus assembly protein CpaE|nr:AAA family ATPase [Acidobacteriaceae bacterium]
MSTFTQDPDSLGTNILSVALIGPDEQGRRAVATALAESQQAKVTREFSSYPDLDYIPQQLESEHDVIIVELDSNPEYALDLVEHICGNTSLTVMVYSSRADSELLVRCMQAGAREFLIRPIAPNALAEALVRAMVRRPAAQAPKQAPKKVAGKLFVFAGAKGGSGVTTLASNFAVALAQESAHSTLLIDLDLPLGDAALELGINAQFSTANAIQNIDRLDSNFLSKLLTKHSSGLSVLSAPDKYTQIQVSDQAVERLLSVARQEFDYVVIDAGSRISSSYKALMAGATTIYLITQVTISELRNANRLISEFYRPNGPKFEIILNRFLARSLGIDEENITKALTLPVAWKIPSDYPSARRAQNTATPLAMSDSQISKIIRQMARTACGQSAVPEKKKKGFRLFG